MSYHTSFCSPAPILSIDPTLLSLSPNPKALVSNGMRFGPEMRLGIDLNAHNSTAESNCWQSSTSTLVATQSAFPSPSTSALDYEVKDRAYSQPPEHLLSNSPQLQRRCFQSTHQKHNYLATKRRRHSKQFYRSLHSVNRAAPTSAPFARPVSSGFLSEKLDYILDSEALKELSVSEDQAPSRSLAAQLFSHTSSLLNLQELLMHLQQVVVSMQDILSQSITSPDDDAERIKVE